MKWPRCSYQQVVINIILTLLAIWLFARVMNPTLSIDLHQSGYLQHL